MTDALKNPERQLSSIAHIVSRGAEIHPDRVAVDDLLRGRKLSYRDLDERINRLARALGRLGLRKGDFLGVMLWNEHAAVETIFACARAGIVVAPLNVRLLADEVAGYVNYHGCKAIVTNADFESKFAGAEAKIRISTSGADGWLDYDTLVQAEDAGPLAVVTSLDDPVRLVSTGGTTGMSKGVLHSHVGVYFTVLGNIAEFDVRRGWNTIMIMPTYHAAGMDWGMLPVFWRVGTVVFPADTSFNPAKYKSTSQKQGLLKLASDAMKPYGTISTEMDRIGKLIAKGPKQIMSFFKNPSYCTMANSDREKRIAGFGLKPRVGFKKASLLEDLFIRSAHAATGEHFFMSYDLSISGGVGIGGSFGISFVTDYRGSNAGYISVGPGIVTNATIGGAFAIGFYPKVSADSFAGWGWSFGAAGGPFKVVSGGIDFFFDEDFKVFQGFAVNVGGGIGLSPVDVNVSASHAWKL